MTILIAVLCGTFACLAGAACGFAMGAGWRHSPRRVVQAPAVGSRWRYRGHVVDVYAYPGDEDEMVLVFPDGKLRTTSIVYFNAVARPLEPEAPVGEKMARLTAEGMVRLPPALVEKLGLNTGDFVHYIFETEGIRVVNADTFDAYMQGKKVSNVEG